MVDIQRGHYLRFSQRPAVLGKAFLDPLRLRPAASRRVCIVKALCYPYPTPYPVYVQSAMTKARAGHALGLWPRPRPLEEAARS